MSTIQSQFLNSLLGPQTIDHSGDEQFLKKINGIINTCETIDKLCLTCNKIAMDYLATNNFEQSFKLLKNAEKILINENHGMTQDVRNKLLSLTFNNMGCYYKKKDKPNVALFYLKNSLEIEENDQKTEKINLAGTHLNLCAIYSKLLKHKEATFHAKQSIQILEALIKIKEQQKQQKINSDELTKKESQQLQAEDQKRVQFDESTIQRNSIQEEQVKNQEFELAQIQKKKEDERKQKLEENNLYLTEAIAYYNLAASYEHQINLDQSLKAYQVAQQIAKLHLGEAHPLYTTINDSMKKAEEKKKSNDTTHMLRDYMRKEKATSSIFKNGNISVMFKRLQRQSQMLSTISQNHDIKSDILSQSPDQTTVPQINDKRIRLHKRGNSTHVSTRPLNSLNRTQANSLNSSLVDIHSALNQQTLLSGDLDEAAKNNQILAMSNMSQAIKPLQEQVNQRRFSTIDVQSEMSGQINLASSTNPHQFQSSFLQNYNQQQNISRKPQTANQGMRSRSNKYATSLVMKANKPKIIQQNNNFFSNSQLFDDEANFTTASRPITQNGKIMNKSIGKARDQQIKSLYTHQTRLPMDIESIRYDQISPKVINGFPQEKSLTRLNRRLQTLENQVQNQFNK